MRFTTILKKWAACFGALVLVGGMAVEAQAQAVIFPQEQQPGTATLTEASGVYMLKNDLFSAKFEKKDGKLTFAGSEEMNLESGTELFRIELQNGTVVNASEMTLGEVKVEALTGNPSGVRGAHRFNGQQLVANFTYGNLNVVWRAVLRDGSHYLRTELSLTANGVDVAMKSVTPMIYNVNSAVAGSAPVVVGNTRGAVLASDKIFAGLETPMGINSVGTAESSLADFSAYGWTETSWNWTPGDETPAEILAFKTLSGNADITKADVVGMHGYITFKEDGDQQITFQYSTGSHRLNLVGVDILDLEDGNVVKSDYHLGYTGGNHSNNVYTLTDVTKGSYIIRFFVETKTETITSGGTISYDKKVGAPNVVFDLPPVVPAQKLGQPTVKAIEGGALEDGDIKTDMWNTESWTVCGDVPLRIGELGYGYPDVKYITQPLSIATPNGTLSAEFIYASGNNGLSIVGMDLVDNNGNVVVSDYHKGFSGNEKNNHIYSFVVPSAGEFTLRYFCENKTEANTSTGNINVKYEVVETIHLPASAITPIQGLWSRNTTLQAGKTWNVGAVVGLIAPDQARRSFLAYSERERAVPWRAFPVYISWYELNINRNNDINYTTNMNVNQCTEVMEQWKANLFDKYGVAVQSFVWDDGWDNYGTWTFNPNFPNGFSEPDAVAKAMGSNIGCWLGPVGGYGQSGNYRRSYWSDKGDMQLSNPDYYNTFLTACSNMVNDYSFNFFKYDGISDLFSATGPKGEEDAEAIIDIEQRIREIKPDIFLNTTVGTWASPFWFQYTDAVWRQENDCDYSGNNSIDRENWITYRDRLVYQNFVQNSPLCPINTLMTHGFILSKHGPVPGNRDYDAVLRELRCAFACGSGMVELYNDFDLMNSIKGGALWADIAECIKWQEKNADVLPDIHWVGGNPWDGSKANVYGWASWNGRKATFALRNGANEAQTFKTTLRQALEIPAYINQNIVLSKAFAMQAGLEGLETGKPINIDTELTLTLPGSSVFVFDGIESSAYTGAAEYFEAETKYITDFLVEMLPNAGVLSFEANQEKLNELKWQIMSMPATMAEAESRVAALPTASEIVAANYGNTDKDWFIRNTSSTNYVSGATTSGNVTQVSNLSAAQKNAWRIEKAGETENGITPINIYNVGRAEYLNEITSSTYTANKDEAKVWYIKQASGGYAIAKANNTFDDENARDCWNSQGGGTTVAYWSLDGGSVWNFEEYSEEVVKDNVLAAAIEKVENIANILGETADTDELTYEIVSAEGWNAYSNFENNYYRFTNTAHSKVIGINVVGQPAGVDSDAKVIDQLWLMKPSADGFKLYNPNTNSYMSGMSGGAPAAAATMVTEENAAVYNLRQADATAKTFRFAYGTGANQCINMEGSGYGSGDFILDSWGDTQSIFTAFKVESVDVDLKAASIGGAYASVYLPFAVTNEDESVKAYVGNVVENGFIKMAEAGAVQAKAGFILEADAAKTATLKIGAVGTAASSVLGGTTTVITLDDTNRENQLLFGVKKVTGDEVATLGFFRPAAAITSIAANKAYLVNDGSMQAVKISFGGDVTGIEGIHTTETNAPIYDLTGRRVSMPVKGGVYIKNGKKYIVE